MKQNQTIAKPIPLAFHSHEKDMAALYRESRLRQAHGRSQHGIVAEEIEGLIKVYKDGKVERSPIMPIVPSSTIPSSLGVVSRDVMIDELTRLWGRLYVPTSFGATKVPLVVYFHGGGFCVGSTAWSCYNEFLTTFTSTVNCVVLSVEYRLAPENTLPCAYDDAFKSLMWVSQQAGIRGLNEQSWWLTRCNFASLFLAGDSAGGNIAHNVAIRLSSNGTNLKPLHHKGTILIQPFFGGETRTQSEMGPQPASTVLSLAASDAYWRLALPLGSSRDHPWCNPLTNGGLKLLKSIVLPATMVCISEMDILKDRNLEFCSKMNASGKGVHMVVFRGVGHAFQILDNSMVSRSRVHELMANLKSFISL